MAATPEFVDKHPDLVVEYLRAWLDVGRDFKQNPAKAVVRTAYNDPRAAEWLAERAGIPSVLVPFTVGGTDGAKDLFGLYDDTLARLLAAVK